MDDLRFSLVALCLTVAVFGAADASAAQTVTLNAIADTTVDSAAPGLNFGNDLNLTASWNAQPGERGRRILLKFDLSSVPVDAVVESAWLEMERLAPGDDGPAARVVSAWLEDGATWDTQPAYRTPLAVPEGPDAARWDVTAIVIAWRMGEVAEHGIAILDTVGDAMNASYFSRESGSAPRLVVSFEQDVPDDPQPPPGLGAPTFSVDPDVVPFASTLPDIFTGDTPHSRPLAAMLFEGGTPTEFVVNEVIFIPTDEVELETFVSNYAGVVLRSPGLPAPPPALEEQQRPIPPDQGYLIKFDPDTVDPSRIDADAAELGMLGEVRVSSAAGLHTLALVLAESRQGLELSINLASQLTQFPPLRLEEHPDNGGFEDPINDNNRYPELDDDNNNFTGVNRAWQYLAFAARSTSVDVAILDAGFCLKPDGTRCNDGAGTLHIDLPASFSQYDFIEDDYNASGTNTSLCTGGGACPNHGSGSVSIATAVQHNRYGIAGTGSPVAVPTMFRFGNDIFQGTRAIRTATKWGADVLNMSWLSSCDWACRLFSGFSGYGKLKDALQEAETNGVFMVASAGNANLDLNGQFLMPCQLRWTTLCIGALDANGLQKAGFSNYGTKSASPIGTGGVRLWGPGVSLRTGPTLGTTGNVDVSGTSIASPFVAGAVALAFGVDPNLSAKQVLGLVLSTRRAGVSAQTAAGSIDVMRLVQAAGPPLDDALGPHGSTANPADITAAGLDDLTLLPGEDDVFRHVAQAYYDRVGFRARYVEALGDLRIDGVGGTSLAAQNKATGARSTTYTADTSDRCPREETFVRLRGTNAAVANGYELDLILTAATSLPADTHEPNNSAATPAMISAPRESSLDLFTAEVIDCRAGLTLHTLTDADHYQFTVAPGDLDSDFTGVSARINADFPLTARLFRDGLLILSDTGTSVELEDASALPGIYRVDVVSTVLDAYTLRTRIFDPDSRIRGFQLEDWLKNALLADPGELIPRCGGGCPMLPPWLQRFPFDARSIFALEANGVLPVVDDTVLALPLDGNARFFALGTQTAGLLNVTLALGSPAAATVAGAADALDAAYALLIDKDGNEIWRAEGITSSTQFAVELPPGETVFLTVNGQGQGKLGLTLDLPGGPLGRSIQIPMLPGSALFALFLVLLALRYRRRLR